MEFENMTDIQFDVLMNSIIQIVKDSETKDEAVEKLQNLVGSILNVGVRKEPTK